MKITAITRYKHGGLYAALKKIGWSQAELSRQCGLCLHLVWQIINLVKRPTLEQAEKIQRAIGTQGEYFDILEEWPESFGGFRKPFRQEQTEDVSLERLIDHPEILQLEAPHPRNEDLAEAFERTFDTLTIKEAAIIRGWFFEGKSFEELGRELGICNKRAQQIKEKALSKMRHPFRLKMILGEESNFPVYRYFQDGEIVEEVA